MCSGALCTRMPIFIFFLFWSVMRWQRVPSAKRLSVFLSFYGTFKRLNESKRELQFELKWFAKKNHIFSYCHCCCHVKFSYLTISVLCDVFTYFITSHWSCCFSLGACLRQSVASKHTYRLEKWPWTLPKKKMSRRWWPSLWNRIWMWFHRTLEFF